jgi:hypothetical protein
MPNWRKVILSGSNAMLNQITASGLPDGAGTEQLVAISSNGGFVQVGQGNLQSIIDGDWFINEADGYLSASKDVHITGSLSLLSGSLIVQAQHTDSTFSNEGIVFRSTDISDNDNRIRVTTAENMQFNAAASFQFKPRDGHFVILDNRKLQLNTEGNAAKARIVATSGSVPGQVRLDIENASNSPKVSIITSGSSGLEGNVGIGTTTPREALEVAGNIRAVGNIIAEQYIVSSSVTHMTQSFSSGSTIFGDTNNDTHQFTGSILILHTSSVDQENNIGLQISGSGLLIDNGEHGKLAMGQHNVGLEFAGVGFPITGSGLIISQSFINEATHHNMVKIGETELVDISGSLLTDSFLLNIRNKALVVSSSTLDKPVAEIANGNVKFYNDGDDVFRINNSSILLIHDAISLVSNNLQAKALTENNISNLNFILGTNASPNASPQTINSYDTSNIFQAFGGAITSSAVSSSGLITGNSLILDNGALINGSITASAVSSSGLLFASLSYADGTQFQVVLYDSSSGRFYHTGSSIGGGTTTGGTVDKAYKFIQLAGGTNLSDVGTTLEANEATSYLRFISGSNIILSGTDDGSDDDPDSPDIINISAIPTGSNSHVQYNDSGLFGGTGSFVFNDVNKSITVGNISGPTNITGPSIYEATPGNLYAGEAGTKHQMTDGQPLSTNARYVKARYDIVGLGRGALAGGAIDHTVGSSPTPQGVAFGTFPAFNVLEGNSTTIGGDLTIGNLFAETNDLGKTRLYVNGLYIQPGSPGILLEDGVISFYPSASVTHSNDTSGSIITPLASASGKISLTEAVNPINTTFDIIGRRTTQFKSGDSGSEKNYMMFDKATGVFGIGDGISSGDISKISNKALFISGAFKTTGSSEFDSVTLTHGSELKGTSTEGSDVLIAKIDSNSRIQLGNTGDNLSINAPLTASKVHFSDAGQFQFEANELSLANLPANNNSLMFLGQPARVIPRTGEVTLSSYPDNILLRQAKIGVQEIDGISGGGGAAAQGGHFGATMFAEVDALDIRNPRTGSDGGRSGILFTSNPNIFFFNDNAIGSVSGSNVPDSASAQIKFDTGSNALKFFAGSTTETLKEVLHISKSGDNPRIGIGTTDPKTVFDFKDVEDTTTGAELLIRSARSTQGALSGDEGGSINFVIDSGSFTDLKTTGSIAKIKTKVTDVFAGGVAGKLAFELSKTAGGSTIDAFEYGFNIGGQGLFAAVQTASLIIKDFSAGGKSVLQMRDFSDNIRFEVNDGDVEISGSLGVTGSAHFKSNVDIDGTLSLGEFTDVSASLAAAVAGGDNLGNHTAATTLDLDGNSIKDALHITASGNISASGTIVGSNLSGTNTGDQDLSSYIQASQTSSFLTEISSGIISSSAQFGSSDNVTFGTIEATSLNVTNITSSIVTSSIIQTEGSNIFGDTISDTQTFNGHITASGNISASGQIIAEAGPSINVTLASDSATNIDTFNTSSNNGAIYDYTLFSAPSGARAGQCMVIHHNGNTDFTDTSTPTLGSETSIPFFETAVNGANVEVKIASGSGYTFKTFVKKL